MPRQFSGNSIVDCLLWSYSDSCGLNASQFCLSSIQCSETYPPYAPDPERRKDLPRCSFMYMTIVNAPQNHNANPPLTRSRCWVTCFGRAFVLSCAFPSACSPKDHWKRDNSFMFWNIVLEYCCWKEDLNLGLYRLICGLTNGRLPHTLVGLESEYHEPNPHE